jgi:hypothetical protein
MPAGDEPDGLTWEGLFSLQGAAFVTDDAVNMYGSDITDMRQYLWMFPFDNEAPYDSIVPFKYKPFNPDKPETVEYSTVLRLAEQYLIRAEARARQGNDLTGAAEDLNAIRGRAGATPVDPNSSQDELLLAVELERRKEFFFEWGHRWFDLKRTGRASVFLAPLKGTTWQSSDELYPIPASEIAQNPHLNPQNNGY